jgi:chromatin segregation and condensation protein Rec8/ScpA/Scc1 (kleisin family)
MSQLSAMGSGGWRELVSKPVKDIAKNFNVDVDKILGNYLDALENIDLNDMDGSMDDFAEAINGLINMNFGEAAMIVQNSATIYSKKVDHLQKIYDDTLRVFRAERKGKKVRKKQGDANETNNDPNDEDDDEDEDQVSLSMPKMKMLKDSARVVEELDSERQLTATNERNADAILAVKPSILLAEDQSERGIDLQNKTNGETIGQYRDFYCNRITIHNPTNAGLLDENSQHLMTKWLDHIKSNPRAEWLPAHFEELEGMDFKGDFQQDDTRFDLKRANSQQASLIEDVHVPSFQDDPMDQAPDNDFDEAPVPQGFEDNGIPPLLSTSMMDLQEQLAPTTENSYRNLESVKLIMRNKVPVFNEFTNNENQAETIASRFQMLKDRPIKIKKGAILKLTSKTYQLWKEQSEKNKASKNGDKNGDLEKSTFNKSAFDKSGIDSDASRNETQLEPKSKKKNSSDIEPISTFIERMKFNHLRKLPSKNAQHAITYPELCDWYWEEVERRRKVEKSKRAPKPKVFRQLTEDEPVSSKRRLPVEKTAEDEIIENEEHAVLKEMERVEQFDDFAHGVDEGFDGGVGEGFNGGFDDEDNCVPNLPFAADDDNDDDEIFGTDMGENDEQPNSFFIDMELDFENLVRKSVDDYFKQAQKFAKTTDLDKRVREWQDRLEPVLHSITSRESFNLHRTADRVIQNFKEKQQVHVTEKCVNKVKSWTSVQGKNTKYQACTMFASMLQLANNGNIEIITDQNLAGTEACVDSLKLKLLTADRLQDRFDEMDV